MRVFSTLLVVGLCAVSQAAPLQVTGCPPANVTCSSLGLSCEEWKGRGCCHQDSTCSSCKTVDAACRTHCCGAAAPFPAHTSPLKQPSYKDKCKPNGACVPAITDCCSGYIGSACGMYGGHCAPKPLRATRCDDPPCTPDVLLFGSFNGSSANATTHKWQVVVADNSSSATFDTQGVFSGSVGASGFAMAHSALLTFPSIWGCRGILVTARSSSTVKGFTLSFGTGQLAGATPEHQVTTSPYNPSDTYSRLSKGYKGTLDGLPASPQGQLYLPLDSSAGGFSRGLPSPGVPPSPDCHHDTSVCPTFMQMQNLQVLKVWAEGITGPFELQILSIRATNCYQPTAHSLPAGHS